MIQGTTFGIRHLLSPFSARALLSLLVASVTGAGLGACSTQSYAVRTYAERKPVEVTVKNDSYQVLDRPDLGRLLVAGAPDGTSEPTKPRVVAVATRYLAEAGRGRCRVGDGTDAARPFFEVTYSCEKPHARPAPAGKSASAAPAIPRPKEAAAPVPSLRMNRL